jgi:predicted DNA-binding ribbon-helix-helix protein
MIDARARKSTRSTTSSTTLPKLEPAFTRALKSIAHAENWPIEKLLKHIDTMPGTSRATRARLFAITYFHEGHSHPNANTETGPSDPLLAGLNAVSRMNKP